MDSSVVQGFENEDGSFPPRRGRLQKLYQCFKLPISTVRNIIKKWKINGTVEVKTRSGRPRNISDRMARDLGRNAQKNLLIAAKELQKGGANTGLAVHRTTIQSTVDNKDLHGMAVCRKKNLNIKLGLWSMQKKTLISLNPFGTMCFGLMKPKSNFLAITRQGMFGREEHLANCEARRWIH